ncbi:SPIRAL1-like 1-like protein, partial [Drosera capensis]
CKSDAGEQTATNEEHPMGRGVSSGGGQSSLGYLFGGGEAPKKAADNTPAPSGEGQLVKEVPSIKSVANPRPIDVNKQIPAGIHSSNSNNYFRAEGQNSGNFITDRPTTKVHAAPGGGSSLDYLFGGAGSGK